MNKDVKFFLMNENAHIPTRATEKSAGLDLYASEVATIPAQRWGLVKTGIKMELPDGTEGQIRSRSGLAMKKGVFVLNSPGTIDADYRGEIGIILANAGTEDFVVNIGDRIAQLVVADVCQFQIIESKSEDELTNTERGKGGFGSTGVNKA